LETALCTPFSLVWLTDGAVGNSRPHLTWQPYERGARVHSHCTSAEVTERESIPVTMPAYNLSR